jgi:hypothetical protein
MSAMTQAKVPELAGALRAAIVPDNTKVPFAAICFLSTG